LPWTNKIGICHITIPKASGPPTSLRMFILLIGPTMLLIAKKTFLKATMLLKTRSIFSESRDVIDRIIG